MKRTNFLVVCIFIVFTGFVQSQVSVNVNIGTPPAWGPAGYSEVQYYYLPDMEVYYDVHRSNFIYFSDSRWVRRNYLPARYKNYDLYRGYKVPIQNYSGNYPYYHFKQHKIKYAKGYVGKPQKNIGARKNNQNKQHINNQSGNHKIKMNKGNGNKENHGKGKNKK